jgi:hypothetical protein
MILVLAAVIMLAVAPIQQPHKSNAG